MNITPDFVPHKRLEQTATDYMQERGYVVTEQTYHKSLPKNVIEMLTRSHEISSLYIRARADRLAVSDPQRFEFEVKTHSNPRYSDLTLEVLPLMVHMAKIDFIDCLYVCLVNKCEFGFWVSDLPPVRCIFVPNISKNSFIAPLVKTFAQKLGIGVLNKSSAGSGDPFMIIDASIIQSLPNWRDLVP